MKIVILTNRDLASNIALNQLVEGLVEHDVQIFLSDTVGATSSKPQPLIDLKFFEQDLFNQIVFPAIDKTTSNSGSEQNSKCLKTFQQLAIKTNHPLDTLNDVNEINGLEKLSAAKPDLVLSIRFGKILKDQAIAIPRLGVLNLHSGLLPKYQGVMATFWAMLNKESEYGSTLHFIDSAAIDAGPIVGRFQQKLDLSKSYLENVLALYQPGCAAMLDAVNRLAAGENIRASEQSGESNYYTFPTQEELVQFQREGFNLFNTSHIMQLVKAYQGDE